MKWAYLFFWILFPLNLWAGETKGSDWNEVLETKEGQFAVSVRPAEKKIEVKKIAGDQNTPPHLRVRVLRENDRPFELGLKTVERADSPLFMYRGQLKQWNDSYIGLEIDFSFDKKTWKRLGKTMRKAVP